jgi:hypothetical protein
MFVRVFELDVVERAVGSLLQGCHLRLSLSHFLQKCANALNYPKIFGILFAGLPEGSPNGTRTFEGFFG